MFIIKLWNYLMGYLVIVIEGRLPERFINMCTNKGIYLWDIKRKNDEVNIAKISIDDFKNIRGIVRKTKVNAKIFKKKGIPFLANKYKKRRATILIGVVLFLGVIYTLSMFIWQVELIGNVNISSESILKNLEELGVKRGAFRNNLDSKELKNEMLLRMSELAWIKVDITGTKVIVEVVESVPVPNIIPKDKPCDIIASVDGIIVKILVSEGIQKAFVDQTVKKGDLLVSGISQSKYGDVKYVHSLADIKLRTWYEGETEMYYNSDLFEPTGNIEYKYQINLFGKLINFGNINSTYLSYNKEITEKKIGNIPITILVNKYIEKEQTKDIPTKTDLLKEGERKVVENVKKSLKKDIEIIEVKNYTEDIKNGIKVTVVLECLENGTEFREIVYDGGM